MPGKRGAALAALAALVAVLVTLVLQRERDVSPAPVRLAGAMSSVKDTSDGAELGGIADQQQASQGRQQVATRDPGEESPGGGAPEQEITGRALLHLQVEGLLPDHRELTQFGISLEPDAGHRSPAEAPRPVFWTSTLFGGESELFPFQEDSLPPPTRTVDDVEVRWRGDGSGCVVDFTSLLLAGSGQETLLSLVIEHEVYHGDRTELPLGRDPVRWTREGRDLELEATVSLSPAAAIHGRIQFEKPLGSLPLLSREVADGIFEPDFTANVALFRIGSLHPAVEDTTDQRGYFSLKADEGGRYLLAAHREGYPVTCWEVWLKPGEKHLYGSALLVRNGLAIEGTVNFVGLPAEGDVGVEVMLAAKGAETPLVTWGGPWCYWHEERLFDISIESECDEDGNFRIGGLVDTQYEVVAFDSGFGAIRNESVVVTPPATGVHIQLPIATLRICTHRGVGPCGPESRNPGSISLSMLDRGWSTFMSFGGGTGEIRVRAGQAMELTVWSEGLHFEPVQLLTPAPGEELTLHLLGTPPENR